MINSIIITDLSTAVSNSFKEGKENVWVSAVDESDRKKIRMMKNNFASRRIPHFSQYFYDWSDEDNDVYIQKHIEEAGPKEQHVNNIISFLRPIVESPKVYNLGVNCYAGVSRSTAIGIIAWVLQGKSPQEALKEIIKVRPMAWPNLRILKFASTILRLDLKTPVIKWKETTSNGIYTGGWS
jgi:hypothetical protein